MTAHSTAQLESKPADKKPGIPAKGRRNSHWAGYWHLLGARLKELRREPEVVFWIFAFPILLALGLGIAFRNKPADVSRVAVVAGTDAENTAGLLTNGFHAEVLPRAAALQAFRLGKVDLVVIPRSDGSLEYEYDPSRPESVLAKASVNDAIQAGSGRKDVVPTSAHISSEPGARYIDFLIPGLLGMNLMGSGMWGIGFALVEMRQRKLLKRFLATPMRRSDFLMAIGSSRLVLMIVELVLLLGFGALVFKLPVRGALLTILLVSTVGALTFAGLGLLSASRASKIETANGIINVVMLPMWVFSGCFFSYERFPAIMQPFIKALPLTALNDALRSTILEGGSLRAQGSRLLIMCLWGGVSFILALKWFRWA
ncbi:MAG TPA: ABC transporter permease [Terriglobales bacterium]|nr:ABC transporter permease [Terriglobales bacterium]